MQIIKDSYEETVKQKKERSDFDCDSTPSCLLSSSSKTICDLYVATKLLISQQSKI